MGRRKKGRPVSGILLLDKSTGVTSNFALQQVRRLFDAAKAGHTGSLDPLAEGMLPICFGEATKLSGYLLDANKTYEARIRLGQKTDTGDADGEVIQEAAVPTMSEDDWRTAAAAFLGETEQVPPMYSAVKHQGKRLYELARAGEEVEREARPITVHEFELLSLDGDSASWRIRCSKGTYVRTLLEDLAESKGTLAHVTALRRVAVGPFAGEMHSFESLAERATEGPAALDALLLPPSAALDGWPRVEMDRDAMFYFRRGQPIQIPRAPTEGQVAVFGPAEQLIGVGEILDDGRVGPRRLLELGRANP